MAVGVAGAIGGEMSADGEPPGAVIGAAKATVVALRCRSAAVVEYPSGEAFNYPQVRRPFRPCGQAGLALVESRVILSVAPNHIRGHNDQSRTPEDMGR